MASRDVRAGRAFVELFVKNNKFIRGLRNAQRRLRDFGSAATAVGRQVAIAGTLMFAPFIVGVTVLTQFSDIMLTVKAVTSATADDFANLTMRAKELGRTTSFTARQVGEMQVVLGRGGFNPAQILKASDSILALARATGTDLAESADIAAASLRRFGLDVGQIGRVTDVLTAAANNSAQTLSDLGQAMNLAGPIAKEFGLTIEQTAKAIGVLANFGIKDTMAGTGLRQIFLQLSDPAIRQKLAGMGVSLEDFGRTMLDIGKVTEDLSGPERLAFLKELFGQRAAGAGAKLGKEAFEQLEEAIDNAGGAAKRTAAEMDSGIGGSFRRFMSAVEGGFIAIGESIAEPLKVASEFATVATGLFTKFAEENPKAVASFAGLALAIAATGVALIGIGTAATIAAVGVGLVASSMTAVIGLFTAAVSPAVLLGGAITALGAGLLFLARNTAPVKAASESVAGFADSLRSMVSTVADDAVTAWEGITAAVQAGDMEAAMAVVKATLQLEWARIVTFWMDKTEGFRSWWRDVTFDLTSLFIDATSGMQKAWVNSISFMKKEWQDWTNGPLIDNLDAWGTAIKKKVIFALEKVEGLLDRLKAAAKFLGLDLGGPGVQDALEALSPAFGAAKATRDAFTTDTPESQAIDDAFNARTDAEKKVLLDGIEADRKSRQEINDINRTAVEERASVEMAGLLKRLEDAKQAQADAVAAALAAANAPERHGSIFPGGPDGEGGGLPANLQRVLEGRGGTFSTSAAVAMQGGTGGGPEERTARATEKAVKELEEIKLSQEALRQQLGIVLAFS